MALLRELAAAGGESRTLAQAYEKSALALATNPRDLPFSLIYFAEPDGKMLSLVGWSPLGDLLSAVPIRVDIREASPWPLAQVIGDQTIHVIDDLEAKFGDQFPPGAWDQGPRRAALIPIPARGETGRQGVLVAGLNPFRLFDDGYRSFLTLAGREIAASLANAQAYEDERRRAEALAEIDRAKTLFFSNVSHEFRTPLTLTLGPLEDALGSRQLPPEQRERLATAHRNSIRLLKLVNSLLDFSRIEVGRAQATYEPTDLTDLTAELASNFRSACERAGLQLIIDCSPLAERVYVDRDMWEKIVLNLISNAFKFTFEGEIVVGLGEIDGHAQLKISDTGVGIPHQELPRLFERFHRIEGQRSRTYEGSGIGLALVQELVKLHKGNITATSAVDQGTSFTVSIPLGRSHLPPDRIGAERAGTSTAVLAYVDEAMRWLPHDESNATAQLAQDIEPVARTSLDGRILLADDNADMRAYVTRLLGQHFHIRAVADGQAAIEAIREDAPDLVLADVMMPRRDGLDLVRAVRADPAVADLPVILLSARADEEARLEGLNAGADDYLVKPFSAHELIARISANLKLAKLRQQAAMIAIGQKRVLELVASGAPLQQALDALMGFLEAQKPDLLCALILASNGGHSHPTSEQNVPAAYTQALQRAINESSNKAPYFATCYEAVQCEQVIFVPDVAAEQRHADSWRQLMLASGLKAVHSLPFRGTDGAVLGCLALYSAEPGELNPTDERLISIAKQLASIAVERDHSRRILQYRTEQFETLFNQAPLGIYLVDAKLRLREVNPTAGAAFNIAGDIIDRDFDEIIHIVWPKNYADEIVEIFRHTLATGNSYTMPHHGEVRADRGIIEHYEWRVDRITLPDGSFGAVCYFRDIAGQVEAESIRQLLLRELNHRVKNTLASVQAIAQQTMRSAKKPEEFTKRFSGRIQSLARVHALLTDSTWRGADLKELIRDQLLHGSVDETRLTAWGSAVHLQPQMATHLAVMLHELGTNSIKYGALSVSKGWVAISWKVTDDVLNLQWIERGGPVVSAPSKRGFGTALIEQSAKSEGGKAELVIEPDGITWRISLRLPKSDVPLDAGAEQPTMSKPAPVTQPAAGITKPAAPLTGWRFLVIEDESLIALDLVDRLEKLGAEQAHSVSTEEESLRFIEGCTVDCALLDANLHGRPVNNVAAALTRRKIPFVFVTGYGREGLPTEFKQAAVIAKPISDEELLEAVSGLTSRPKELVRLGS